MRNMLTDFEKRILGILKTKEKCAFWEIGRELFGQDVGSKKRYAVGNSLGRLLNCGLVKKIYSPKKAWEITEKGKAVYNSTVLMEQVYNSSLFLNGLQKESIVIV